MNMYTEMCLYIHKYVWYICICVTLLNNEIGFILYMLICIQLHLFNVMVQVSPMSLKVF